MDKAQRALTTEVVKLTAASLISAYESNNTVDNTHTMRILLHHRNSSTSADFGKLLSMELEPFLNQSPRKVLALTIEDVDTTSGTFLLSGPSDLIQLAGPIYAQVVEGRGGGKGDKFQGKCKSINKFLEAAQAAHDAIKGTD